MGLSRSRSRFPSHCARCSCRDRSWSGSGCQCRFLFGRSSGRGNFGGGAHDVRSCRSSIGARQCVTSGSTDEHPFPNPASLPATARSEWSIGEYTIEQIKRQFNNASARRRLSGRGCRGDHAPAKAAVAAPRAAAKPPVVIAAPIKKRAMKKPNVTWHYASRDEPLGLYRANTAQEECYYASGARGGYYRDGGHWETP